VPSNREQDRADRQTYVQAGIMTINEVREEIGLPPVKWGEEALLPFSLVPAGFGGASPNFEAVSAPAADQLEEVQEESVQKVQRSAETNGRADERERRWRRFIQFMGPHERRFTKGLQGLFLRQKREVMKRLREVLEGSQFTVHGSRPGPQDIPLIDAILFDERNEVMIFRGFGEKAIRDIMRARGAVELADLALDLTFDDSRQPVIEFGKQLATKYAREVTDTTRRQLQHQILEGMRLGETIDELASRVERVYAHATDFRAVRIARTVTIGASNAGADAAYRQSGVVEAQEWLTARDERVRDTHAAAEGQRVAIGSAFQVGGASLRFPADPQGPPGEIINCRCTVIPVVEG
jgi:SPP1 gp7 family putative phage head morphogenesis protein